MTLRFESDDNSVEILDGLCPIRKARKKSSLSCPLPNKRAKTNPRNSYLQPGDPHFRAEVTKATGTMLEKSKMNAGLPYKGLNLTLFFMLFGFCVKASCFYNS